MISPFFDNGPVSKPMHLRFSRFFVLSSLTIALCAFTGCGSGIYPVEGKVVWADGSPATELAGSQVVFEQPVANTTARGTINADASFHLTTNTPDDGVVAGEHKVLVLEVGRQSLSGPDGTNIAPGALNPKFYTFETSGLTATVKPGTNEVTLKVERNPQR